MNSFALYNLVSSKDSKEYFNNLYYSKLKRKIWVQDSIIKKGASLVVIKESLAGAFGRSYMGVCNIQKRGNNQPCVRVIVIPLVIGFN